ncbi:MULTISPECIES: DUF2726 domain-containing protein [unclassified Pseudocitrobacter]|uniref:DUF2726 domain-containing protein n=1 Tax=unclassified Pseudocitrobacter TaxID=2638778 RepID=UPI0023E3FD0F|nr:MULTISPECIES: DUF2726 domain-containing protein [unclassified Pseudocitrobacter]MDF3828368.1 DUF2726 domain-containing protein [Pseudocitrobacter sp. 2023EL-00150]MEC5374543.1 DUF2726 domain-containing protein [Pseudocitrobacter sp. MW920760]
MEYIIIIAVLFVVLGALANKKKPRKTFKPTSKPENQLDIVARSDFHKSKLMNKEEYGLFIRLEPLLKTNRPGHRLFTQVSMGELIGSPNKNAYFCINNKRVDFVIISPYGDPLVVIEYQGGGHYQGNAVQRDAVKKEACRKAGIAFIELNDKYSDRDLDNIILHIPK